MENETKNQQAAPRSLKLEFSKAADYDRVNAAFAPERLKQIDPHGFVARRLQSDFRAAVESGAAAFLADEDEPIDQQVKGMLFAYRYPEYNGDEPVEGTHEYTEYGTAMSYLPGYGSAKLIMAALALKEWLHHSPSKKAVNEIENSNIASTKTYRDKLKWEAVTDESERDTLFTVCYRNVPTDEGQGIGKPPPPSKQGLKSFYAFTDDSLAIHAQILLDYLDAGGVSNKQGDFIPVDFSALEDAGLTYERIQAMADGETSREAIMKIGGQGDKPRPPVPN